MLILKVEFIPVVLVLILELCVFTGSHRGDCSDNVFSLLLSDVHKAHVSSCTQMVKL